MYVCVCDVCVCVCVCCERIEGIKKDIIYT